MGYGLKLSASAERSKVHERQLELFVEMGEDEIHGFLYLFLISSRKKLIEGKVSHENIVFVY